MSVSLAVAVNPRDLDKKTTIMFEQLWDSELLIIYPLVQSINISTNNIFLKNTAVKIIKVNFLGFVIDTPCMNWFIITQKIKYAFIFLSPCCFLLCNYGDHTTFHPNWDSFESERDITNNYTKTTGMHMNRPRQPKCMILLHNVYFIFRMPKRLPSFKNWDSVLKWNILSSFNRTHLNPLIF